MTTPDEILNRYPALVADDHVKPDTGHADRLRHALVDTHGLDHIEPPQPLVNEVLYANSLAWLQGKPGDGKTFVALDLAGSVATGTSWHGHITEHGQVLYIAAEGVTGVRGRVRAWESAIGQPMTGVQWLPVAVQAANETEWAALVDLAPSVAAGGLIVVDTQARVTVGMEENAARDMGVFVQRLEELRQATGACILVVHHQGRSGDHMRGSTALEGAATTVMQVAKEDTDITVKCVKQKDAERFSDIHLELTSYGDSAVLMLTGPGTGKPRLGAALKTAAAWWATFGDDTVSMTRLVEADIATKPTLYRHLRTLVDAGIAVSNGSETRRRYSLSKTAAVSHSLTNGTPS